MEVDLAGMVGIYKGYEDLGLGGGEDGLEDDGGEGGRRTRRGELGESEATS